MTGRFPFAPRDHQRSRSSKFRHVGRSCLGLTSRVGRNQPGEKRGLRRLCSTKNKYPSLPAPPLRTRFLLAFDGIGPRQKPRKSRALIPRCSHLSRTTTASSGLVRCLPARTRRRVLLPAPFWPISRHLSRAGFVFRAYVNARRLFITRMPFQGSFRRTHGAPLAQRRFSTGWDGTAVCDYYCTTFGGCRLVG